MASAETQPLLAHGDTDDEDNGACSKFINKFRQLFFAIISLLPILDMVTDYLVLIKFLKLGWYWFFSVGCLILILSYRFSVLYGAINPKPTLYNVLRLYIPFALGPAVYARMASVAHEFEENDQSDDGDEATDDEATERPTGGITDGLTDGTDEPTDEDETSTSRPSGFRLSEILFTSSKVRHRQAQMRDFLSKQMQEIRKRGILGYAIYMPLLELRLLFLSQVVGPFFVGMAAVQLSTYIYEENSHTSDADKKKLARQKLLNKVITFIEALFESTPQIILQTLAVLYNNSNHIPTFNYFSISLSAVSIIHAIFNFVSNYQDMLRVLGPMRVIDVAGRTGWYVDAIILRYNDGYETVFGDKTGGDYNEGLQLEEGEVIVRLQGSQFRRDTSDDDIYFGEWMVFTTNKGRQLRLQGNHLQSQSKFITYSFEQKSGITGIQVDTKKQNHAWITGVY